MNRLIIYLTIWVLGNFSTATMAQDSIPPVLKRSAKSAVMKLSTSLESGKSDDLVASDYEALAKTLIEQGEYEKAENYLLNARKLYDKLKDKEKTARVDREIGRIQETLGKIDAAILSYASAAHLSRNEEFRELNNNDVNRLKNFSDPMAQSPISRAI